MPVRASYGPRTGISNIFQILRGPWGTRKAPLWTSMGIDTTRICVVYGRTGPLRPQHGLFTGCVWSLNPYGARKHMMPTVRAPYGEATFVRRRTVPVSGRTMFVQNSPGTAHTVPGNVMWQRHHITLPGPVRVHGLFWTKIIRPLTGPARAPCGAVHILPLRTGPVEF